jgi:type I restriction enzyme M protein
LLKELLKTFSTIPMDLEGDSFGKIYEYFLAEFAATPRGSGWAASSTRPPPSSA